MFMCSDYILSFLCPIYLNMYVWMSWNHWCMFPYQYVESKKTGCSFFVVFLTKPNDPSYQTGLSSFDRLNIWFSIFYLLWSSYHVHHVIHVHTHKSVALIRCIDIGRALLDFQSVQNGIFRPNLNFIQYAHI
jgi:hypothetical protein